MKDGKEIPNSTRIMTAQCAISGKNILEEIGRKKDVAIRIRGKKRTNTCVVLISILKEIIGVINEKNLIPTSKDDFNTSLVSFVLPVENLSHVQKSLLSKRFSGDTKRVFY